MGAELPETSLFHRSAWKVNSPKLAKNSPGIHLRSLGYWWGGSTTFSEQLLLPSRVARSFPVAHPLLSSLFTRVPRS
jgi:hypothetical protein